jgi:hypothetical protein
MASHRGLRPCWLMSAGQAGTSSRASARRPGSRCPWVESGTSPASYRPAPTRTRQGRFASPAGDGLRPPLSEPGRESPVYGSYRRTARFGSWAGQACAEQTSGVNQWNRPRRNARHRFLRCAASRTSRNIEHHAVPGLRIRWHQHHALRAR